MDLDEHAALRSRAGTHLVQQRADSDMDPRR
jgi:hypothetical protein